MPRSGSTLVPHVESKIEFEHEVKEAKTNFPTPAPLYIRAHTGVHPRGHRCTSARTSLYIRAHIGVHPRCTNSCCYLNLKLSCIPVYKFGYLPPPPPTLTNICKLQVFLNLAARLRPPSPLPRRTGGLSLGALGYGGFIARRRYRVDGDESSVP